MILFVDHTRITKGYDSDTAAAMVQAEIDKAVNSRKNDPDAPYID